MTIQLKKLKKSLFLLIALLFVRSPEPLQATQSNSLTNPKKFVIPTFAAAFLSNSLKNLSDTTQSDLLRDSLSKLESNPTNLTRKENKILSQYVRQETMKLSGTLLDLEEEDERQSMEQTQKELGRLFRQIKSLQKPSSTQSKHVQRPKLKQSHSLELLTQPKHLQPPTTLRRPDKYNLHNKKPNNRASINLLIKKNCLIKQTNHHNLAHKNLHLLYIP